MDPLLDTQKYDRQLDHLLQHLKAEIDDHCQSLPGPGDGPDTWDEYLLAINSFYYQSFAHRLVPRFRQLIADDIRDLYRLQLQETSVKQAVMASIRQQVRMYNYVKSISAGLKDKRRQIQSLGLTALHESEARNVELLYIWKESAQAWSIFLSKLRRHQSFLDDPKIRAALDQYPAHAAVMVLLQEWEAQDAKSERTLHRLLAAWQLGVKILEKFIEDPPPPKDAGRMLSSELEKIETSWDNRKNPGLLRNWYKRYVQKPYQLYLETIRLGSAHNNRPLALQATVQMHDWLQTLLYVTEAGWAGREQGSIDFIRNYHLDAGLDPARLQELAVYSAQTLQKAQESIQDLSSSTRANYSNHSQHCSKILSESSQYLRQQLDGNQKPHSVWLNQELEQLKNRLDLLSNRLELLDEQQEHDVQIVEQQHLLQDSLDSYLGMIQSVQEEITGMLNQRQLNRNFPDMNIHIEHVLITTGAAFPSTYNYLLEEGLVKIQSAPGPAGRILDTAGDIFIIRLDELEEREIPSITISKEG